MDIDPVFDDSIPEHIYPGSANSFVIDASSQDFRILTSNLEWYQQQGRLTDDLTLCSVSEQDMQLIFYLFPNLTHLTLNNVFVIDAESMILLPNKLKTLTLNHCRFNRKFTKSWFTALNKSSIQGITVNQCTHKCGESDFSLSEFVKLIHSAKYIRLLEPGEGKYDMEAADVSQVRMEQVTKKCPRTGEIIYLKYISDVKAASDSIFYQENHMKTIQTVVLQDLPEDLNTIWQLKKLKHLRIVCPLTADVQRKLKTLHLKTLDVWSYDETDEPNTILTVLDDYSLLEIMSLLGCDDVLALRTLHPRFDALVCRHLQNMRYFSLDPNFVKKYPMNQAGIGLYDYLGEHVRSLKLHTDAALEILPHFRNLEKLDYYHRSAGSATLRFIPDGLKELNLRAFYLGVSFKELLRRMDKTLTTLCIYGDIHEDDLKELHHITSLKLGDLMTADINITGFLEQNADHLEILELSLDDMVMEKGHAKTFVNWPPLKSLKKLSLYGLDRTMKGFTIKPQDFPSLVEIEFSIERMAESMKNLQSLIDDLVGFPNLKVLHLDNIKDFKQLFALKNLEQISFFDAFSEEEAILGLFENLPKLQKLGMETEEFSIRFEFELRKILKAQNRIGTVFNVTWPTEFMYLG